MRVFLAHGLAVSGLLLPASAPAHEARPGVCAASLEHVRLEGCSETERADIVAVLEVLACRMEEVDRALAPDDLLMDWPAGARAAYQQTLGGALTIRCLANDEFPCDTGKIAGKVLPERLPGTVHLCAERILGRCDMARTVAHEIGHLAVSNGHEKTCDGYFERPSFSQAVGWAALLVCTPGEDRYDPEALKESNCDGSAWR